jgi:Gpi18-like mannosyltransferase
VKTKQKKGIKKARTFIKGLGILMTLMVLSYFILCFVLALIPVEKEITTEPKKVTIYFMQSGVHTDFIVPVHHKVQHWDDLFPYENNKVYDTTFHWIGLGMGDKRFFLTTPTFNDLTLSTAFRGTISETLQIH